MVAGEQQVSKRMQKEMKGVGVLTVQLFMLNSPIPQDLNHSLKKWHEPSW